MSSKFLAMGASEKRSNVPETSMIIHKRAVKIQDSPEQKGFQTLNLTIAEVFGWVEGQHWDFGGPT